MWIVNSGQERKSVEHGSRVIGERTHYYHKSINFYQHMRFFDFMVRTKFTDSYAFSLERAMWVRTRIGYAQR